MLVKVTIEIAFHRCVELVLGHCADAVGRRVGFVVESGRGLEEPLVSRVKRELLPSPAPLTRW